jgi:hypothetical protein
VAFFEGGRTKVRKKIGKESVKEEKQRETEEALEKRGMRQNYVKGERPLGTRIKNDCCGADERKR